MIQPKTKESYCPPETFVFYVDIERNFTSEGFNPADWGRDPNEL